MHTGKLTKADKLAIDEFSSALRDRFPLEIESIRLYGSKARGQAGPESDIDILVIVKKKAAEIDKAIIEIVCDILNEKGIFIETVTMSSRNYQTALKRQYPFTINVENDGIQL